jgi:hypothetical protein
MKTANRLAVLAFALALNAAAVAALNIAMIDGAERAILANQEPEHVVITATRTTDPVASTNCPAAAAKAL